MEEIKNIFSKTSQYSQYPFFVLGIDIGRTKISFGVIAFNKNKIFHPEILSYLKIKTPDSKKAIIKTIIDTVNTYKKNYKLKGLGISFPCRVDQNGGILDKYTLKDNGWKGKQFKNYLIKKLTLPVVLKNDGQCFILGEYHLGKVKKFSNIAGLVLGTGVGGGIIINKMLYNGSHNIAGDFGYITTTKISLKKKIIEIAPKGESMVTLYQMLTGKKKNTFEIEELAKKNEKNALLVIEYLATALANTISSIIHSLDPEVIILGGGISRVEIMAQKTREILDKKLPPFLRNVRILKSSLNDKANIAGAILFFKETYL